MAKAAAKTGMSPTVLVAIEQYFPKPKRIIEDDLAYRILPAGAKAFVWLMKPDLLRALMIRAAEKDSPGIWGCMMCRKRYIDEKLIESIKQIDAVVNLGAGFDTRTFRLQSLAEMPVWEVDQPENIKAKQTQLLKLFRSIPAHVQLVAMDFDREDLDTALISHGYSMEKRTFFIWEGVTQYLTEKGIRTSFDFLAKAAHGSRLVFTYVCNDFLQGRAMYGWESSYKRFVTNKVWLFGLEPGEWPDFLKEYGWQVIEDIGYEEMAEKYVKPTGRILASTPIERMVYAEKM